MLNQEEAEERAERLAQEKADLDEAHKDLVKCVLSNTRVDPKYKGKEIEFFRKRFVPAAYRDSSQHATMWATDVCRITARPLARQMAGPDPPRT